MNGDVKREWFDKDYYAVLGVSKTATEKEITKAYRKLARKYHPDANPDDDAAEERFKEISTAYDVVGDEDRRKQYDQVRQMGPMGGAFSGGGNGGFGSSSFGGFEGFEGMDISDLLGSMMGGGRGQPRQRKGQDQEAKITISFDEAVRGTTTSLTLTSASGQRPLKVRIPAGVKQGQRIRLRGKGGPGQPPGDLYVIVTVGAHPLFGRKGKHLTLEVPVTFAEATLGADISVPKYGGDRVTVRIPPGTQHGRTLRVRDAGAGGTDDPGDLLVTVRVAVPSSLSPKQQKALEAFADLDAESPRAHLDRVSP